eukprot:435336_1
MGNKLSSVLIQFLIRIKINMRRIISRFARTRNKLLSSLMVVIGLLGLRYIKIKLYRYYTGLPVHGPIGVPFLGCLYYVYFGNMDYFAKYWGKNGGKYFTMRYGNRDVVVLNNLSLVSKLYNNRQSKMPITRPHYKGLWFGKNIQNFVTGNKHWFKRKKFVMKFVVSQHQSNYVETIFEEHFNEVISKKLDECNSKKILWRNIANDIRLTLFISTFRCIFDLNFKIKNNDKAFLQFTKSTMFIDSMLGNYFLLKGGYLSEWVSNVVFRNELNGLMKAKLEYNRFICPLLLSKLHESKQNYNENCLNTFIDHALYEQKNNKTFENKFKYSDEHILVDSFGLIEGKISSATLRCVWGLYLFALFPEIFEQIKNELETIFTDKVFTFSKWLKCHLLRAYIYEVIRTSTFFRIAIARCVEDANGLNIDNYSLPKGTHIMVNQYYIDNFSGNYEYPHTIHLEHHLIEDKDKKKFKLHPKFCSFGFGARDCVGKSIVTKEMTILYANIILNGYKVSLSENDKRKDLLKLQPIQRKLSSFTKHDVYSAELIVTKQQTNN